MATAAIIGGGMLLSKVAEGRQQRKQAKRAQKAADKQRSGSLRFASPEYHTGLMDKYRATLGPEYEARMRTIGEGLGLGQQANMQGVNAALGRRGLSGSGIGFALQNALRTGRQAGLAQSKTSMDIAKEQQAQQMATGTANRGLSASLGAPVTAVPQGPSVGTNILSGIGAGLAGMSSFGAMTGQSSLGGMMGFGKKPQAPGGFMSALGQPQAPGGFMSVGR